ncbi:MAG: UbiA family prenyltransferase [Sphingomicrobium sp.]
MKPALTNEFKAVVEAPAAELSGAYPLVLDLDGTLLRTDLLLEAALNYVKRHPLGLFMLIVWVCSGIAHLKHRLAQQCDISTELLPINERLAAYARGEAERGRTVIAATAANRHLANKVCARFSFICEVLASSETVNLKGARKADALSERYPGGFAYAGDAPADLSIWREARFGIFAGRDSRLRKRLTKVTLLEADFSQARPGARDWLKAARLHQWAKNGLVFLPLLLAGHLLDVAGWLKCVAAFIAMGLTASATYIDNDLFDLDADRQHWTKRNRPLASGRIGIPQAMAAAALLLAAGLTIALASGGLPVLGALILYCAATLGYSLHLKRIPVLDVTVLAALFTMRLGLGAVAADVHLSSWLSVFSMFLFLSLALAKRSTEIGRKGTATAASHGRGYVAADGPLVVSLGVASAFGAVLMMVLYLIHEAFGEPIYRSPQILWGAPVFIGLWLGRVWLLCGRGVLHDDPVAFAITDKTSIWLGASVVASFGAAAVFG